MTISGKTAFDLDKTYIHLARDAAARPIEVAADFWEKIESRTDLQEGRLMAVFPNEANWKTWEMHPAGEEVVMLLSGRLDLILELAEGNQVIELQPGQACIVPRGVWHTAIVHQPGQTLNVTWGAGTQTRPV